MDIVLKRVLAGIALSVVLISGCATKNASTGSAAQTGAAANNGNGGGASTREQGPGGGNPSGGFALTMGKIKSVGADAITIYTASGGMNQPQGGSPGGNGPIEGQGSVSGGNGGSNGKDTDNGGQGAAPENAAGAPGGGEGTAPNGGNGTGEAQGNSGSDNKGNGVGNGGQRGQRSNPFTFSEETTDLKITADTKFITVTFEDNQRVEKEIALSDLKEDDVIQYTFKDGTQEAATITLSNGFGGVGSGWGGGAGGGAGGRSDNRQKAPDQNRQPAESPAPSA